MNFDNDLMLFFRTIYEDSADMDECSAKVKSAVAAVADKLDIVRAELAVKMPATKLCEDGADMLMVPVSYTHLDVYKRQILQCLLAFFLPMLSSSLALA